MATNELQENLDAILLDKNTNLLPENLKKDVTVLGVTGTFEGGGSSEVPVKLFSTIEEMNADTNVEEGQLALVYGEQVELLTATSVFSSIKCVDNVVLPEAVTTDTYITLKSTDTAFSGTARISINSSQFYLTISDNTTGVYTTIRYQSNDGVTYTRADTLGTYINLGNPFTLADTSQWSDTIAYFIQNGGIVFNGVYEYTLDIKTNRFKFPMLNTATITIDSGAISEFIINDLSAQEYDYSKIQQLPALDLTYTCYYLDNDNNIKAINSPFTWTKIIVNAAGTILGFASSITEPSANAMIYDVDLETLTYSNPQEIVAVTAENGYYYLPITDMHSLCLRSPSATFSTAVLINTSTTNEWTDNMDLYIYEDNYVYAPNQLTVKDTSELLPNKIAYGANGIITGDGSIYDKLSVTQLNDYMGMEFTNTESLQSDALTSSVHKSYNISTVDSCNGYVYKTVNSNSNNPSTTMLYNKDDNTYYGVKAYVENKVGYWQLYTFNPDTLEVTYMPAQAVHTGLSVAGGTGISSYNGFQFYNNRLYILGYKYSSNTYYVELWYMDLSSGAATKINSLYTYGYNDYFGPIVAMDVENDAIYLGYKGLKKYTISTNTTTSIVSNSYKTSNYSTAQYMSSNKILWYKSTDTQYQIYHIATNSNIATGTYAAGGDMWALDVDDKTVLYTRADETIRVITDSGIEHSYTFTDAEVTLKDTKNMYNCCSNMLGVVSSNGWVNFGTFLFNINTYEIIWQQNTFKYVGKGVLEKYNNYLRIFNYTTDVLNYFVNVYNNWNDGIYLAEYVKPNTYSDATCCIRKKEFDNFSDILE